MKLVFFHIKHKYIFGLNSTSLAGFVFLLKGIAYSGEEVSLTGKTGKDGKVYVEWKTEQGKGTIYKLAPGSYMLHETTAPSGYNRAAPQTGDNFNWPLACGIAVAVIFLAILGYALIRKPKKNSKYH